MEKYQRGQILLIVVLVMTVALTIGLSVATRTITNIRTGNEQENSQRAFSAAEAGLEKALQESAASSGTFPNNTSYQTSLQPLGGVDFLLNNGAPVNKDEATDIWLSTYPGYTNPWSGTLTLYWGSASDVCSTNEAVNTMPALQIVLISGTKASPVVTHYPIDPCSARSSVNRFEFINPGGGTIKNKTFAFKKTITVSSGMLMRIVPLYATSTMGVRGCDGVGGNCTQLPAQGTTVTSVGTADTAQRKLIGFRENPKIPMQIFPYILFSPK